MINSQPRFGSFSKYMTGSSGVGEEFTFPSIKEKKRLLPAAEGKIVVTSVSNFLASLNLLPADDARAFSACFASLRRRSSWGSVSFCRFVSVQNIASDPFDQ